MRKIFAFAAMLLSISLFAQKKPLDHTVYDGWEYIQERQISADGSWVAFTVTPQEGDARLMVMKTDGTGKMEVPRGYNVKFTPDSRYAVFLIKPTYAQTRDARIKKKRPDEMPKDTLGWMQLGGSDLKKIARVKNYKMPEEASWMVYQKEKALPDTTKKPTTPKSDPKLDSAKRVIDSLQAELNKWSQIPAKVRRKYLGDTELAYETWNEEDDFFADEPAGPAGADMGSELVWFDFATGKEKVFKNIMEYAIDSVGGKRIALETGKMDKDSLAKAAVIMVYTSDGKVDTIARKINDARNMRFDEAGEQLAFVAEVDSSAKALQKFYKLYYYKTGMDAAKLIVDRSSQGKKAGWTISENAAPRFSKSGKRLMFGVAPVLPLKDTSLPEFERVNVDIWHWNEDYLQPQQLATLNRTLNRSFSAVYFPETGSLVQLADETMENVQMGQDGDLPVFLGSDNRSYRVEAQWNGGGKSDYYTVDPATGTRTLILKGLEGFASLSENGKYIAWYDRKKKQYFTWSNGETRNISAGVKTALWNEDNDVPADPGAYGQIGWHKRDEALYVYDRFDIWKLDPEAKKAPQCITNGVGRKNNIVIRHQELDAEAERSLEDGQNLLFTLFNQKNKTAGAVMYRLGAPFTLDDQRQTFPVAFSGLRKAKKADVIIGGVETPAQVADIRVLNVASDNEVAKGMVAAKTLYQPNPQQSQYNWLTTELIEWKAYDGKMTQGILYKPENFDPNKKYPMIAYFYETVSDGLYRYQAPAPTPSRLNIPFFVSRGYLVLAPDIHYKTGQPAQDAFNYIVSGVRHVVKMGIADSTRLGIQGQSWGGIQVAQLITMTPLFKAAWAGAPVANMTSAYGGIRWGTGLNRQFQYEKTQSRIGATLWERQDLYIKNSPLFALPKVKTPLVIMHNDADDAVPWYQGIELFTGLRRLQKPVWMLNYNGEAHNLVERKNRKDIQIREQQFFDWLLKDAPQAKWLKEGVPAVMKGRDWGLGE
jgi:dipeptidyl aminopeptidase/acylaminoacyl peptidase